MRALASVVLIAGLSAQSPTPTGTTWHTDLTAARQLAAQRQAPLLVVFRCER